MTLTLDEFLEFVKVKNCFYCKSEIAWPERANRLAQDGNTWINSSSAHNLDRLDNSIGYTKENCVVCCPLCNGIRSNILTVNEMLLLGKTINQIKRNRNANFNDNVNLITISSV